MMSKLFAISQNEATAKLYLDAAFAKADAAHLRAREDRFEAAVAANKRTVRAGREAYLNQMPRARGYST
jgi:hypothetical protein